MTIKQNNCACEACEGTGTPPNCIYGEVCFVCNGEGVVARPECHGCGDALDQTHGGICSDCIMERVS